MTNHKATGTASVNNGTATTNQLTINETLTPGAYTIKAKLIENDTYEETTATGTLNILKHDTHIGVANANGYTDDTVDLTASVTDENGDNVPNGSIDWTVYEEQPINLDINDWEYGKLSGTSVPDASLIAPTITNGELSTGRGNLVYYNTPLPSDLTEYTIRCKVHGTRLYNRIGISTITTNNDSTISIDLTKVSFLRDITSVVDDSTTYELEFKFLNNICYIYCDNSYTGISANYTGNDELYLVAFSNSSYNNAITPVVIEELSYVDCVDLNNIPTGGGGND